MFRTEIQYIFIANEYRKQNGNGKPYYSNVSAISIVEVIVSMRL